jgi:adenylate kinase family enzyme
MNNSKIIKEGFYFSDKTISVDLDKFINGKNRLLFVVGVCGSGKTTLVKKLSKQYNVKGYETDNVFKTVVKKYKYDSGDDPFVLYFDEIENFVDSIKGRGIVEGTGLLYIWDHIEKKYNKQSSFIFIGLSHIRGTIRQSIRNSKGVAPYWDEVNDMFVNWIENGMKKEVRPDPPYIAMKKIRKKLDKNRNIQKYSLK